MFLALRDSKNMKRNRVKKKVCILTSHPVFDTRIFHKEAKTLVKAGYSVTLIAPHTRDEKVSNIKIIARHKFNNRLWRVLGSVEVLLLALKQKARVYHFHDLELFLLLVPFLKILRPQSKIVYDVHENYPDAIISKEKHWLSSPFKPLIAFIVEKFEKLMSRKTDLIIAAGPGIQERFLFHNTITIKNYAPMGIINSIYAKRDCDAFRRKNGNKVVLSGSLTNIRAVEEIVRAFEFIDPQLEANLLLIGRYHDEKYKSSVEKEKGYKYVNYIGWIPEYENMLKEVVECRVAVMCFHPDPNLDSAVDRSNKLFEYMGLGLPVIVSKIGKWQEIINKHKCGLCVNPEQPKEIAKAIDKLLGNPKLAFEMGNNGREAVLKYYNWESQEVKLITAYKELSS